MPDPGPLAEPSRLCDDRAMPELLFAGRLTGGAKRGPAARAARTLAYVLIVLGALALVDAGVTLVWQEPLTALYAMLRQHDLGGDLHALERSVPTPLERRTLASLPDEALVLLAMTLRDKFGLLAARTQRSGDPSPAAEAAAAPESRYMSGARSQGRRAQRPSGSTMLTSSTS